MRLCGIVCLAMGLVLLPMGAMPIFLAENSLQVYLGLGCLGFLALPLIVTGVLLTLAAARRLGPDGEAKAAEQFLRGSSNVLGALGGDPVDVEKMLADPVRGFDLNRVTAAGWLLVLAAGGAAIGGTVLSLWLLQRNVSGDLGPGGAIAVVGGLLLAAVVFFGGRRALTALGIPVAWPGEPPAPPKPRRRS